MEALLRQMFDILVLDFPQSTQTYSNALNIILVQFGARPAYLADGDVSAYLTILVKYPDLFSSIRHYERLTREGVSWPMPNHIFYNMHCRTRKQVQNSTDNVDMGLVLGYLTPGESGDHSISFTASGGPYTSIPLYGYLPYHISPDRKMLITNERGRFQAILGPLGFKVVVVHSSGFNHTKLRSSLLRGDIENLIGRRDTIVQELHLHGYHETAEIFWQAVEDGNLEDVLDKDKAILIEIFQRIQAAEKAKVPLDENYMDAVEEYEERIYSA